MNRLKYKIKLIGQNNPFLYKFIKKNVPYNTRNYDHIITKNSSICIEGYPSSANSFTKYIINILIADEGVVYHSLHALANVKLAVKYIVPCIVLLRDPVDAITSSHVRFSKTMNLNIDNFIYRYINFYKGVSNILYGCKIVHFTDIINLDKEYLKKLVEYLCLDINVEHFDIDKLVKKSLVNLKKHEVKKNIGIREALPNSEREKKKTAYKKEVLQNKLISEAYNIYNKLVHIKL
ncbi:MAG: hypothetical protein K8S14_03775 [Actinomycetia bacterium]|nr:hypothetical protein [Actinomycetes bacterium]